MPISDDDLKRSCVAYNILKDNPDVPEPTPEEARRIRNKALAAMLPFYAITYRM